MLGVGDVAEIWLSVSLHNSVGFYRSLLGLVRHTRKGSDTLLGRWGRFKSGCLYSSSLEVPWWFFILFFKSRFPLNLVFRVPHT